MIDRFRLFHVVMFCAAIAVIAPGRVVHAQAATTRIDSSRSARTKPVTAADRTTPHKPVAFNLEAAVYAKRVATSMILQPRPLPRIIGFAPKDSAALARLLPVDATRSWSPKPAERRR